MVQDGGTKDGTFNGEIDRVYESQGRTTACSRVPERDGKDQASGLVLVRSPLLTSHK